MRELKMILKTSHSEQNKIKVAEMILKARGMFKNEHSLTIERQEDTFDHEKARKEIIDLDIDKDSYLE